MAIPARPLLQPSLPSLPWWWASALKNQVEKQWILIYRKACFQTGPTGFSRELGSGTLLLLFRQIHFFFEYLPCTRHSSSSEQNKDPCPQRVYILAEGERYFKINLIDISIPYITCYKVVSIMGKKGKSDKVRGARLQNKIKWPHWKGEH